MGRERKAVSERARPLQEAWDELREEYVYVLTRVAVEAGQQAAGAQAVQALTECTRRLRDIVAEFYPPEDDEDDDGDQR
jgi:hypothetical protein